MWDRRHRPRKEWSERLLMTKGLDAKWVAAPLLQFQED